MPINTMFLDKSRLALVFAIVLALWFGLMTLKGCTDDKKTIGVQEQTIKQLEQNVEEGEKKQDFIEDVKDQQIEAVVDVKDKVVEAKEAKETRQKVSKKKIADVIQDVTLTEDQKDFAVAEIQVDSLWDAYCSTTGSDCSKGETV